MKVIDLSPPLYDGMPVYPGDPEVKIAQVHSLEKEGWRLRTLHIPSHVGSHVDAFSHMDEKGETLDTMSLDAFFGETQVVSLADTFPESIGLFFRNGLVDMATAKKIIKAKAPFIGVGNDAELQVEAERMLLEHKIVTFTDLVNMEVLPSKRSFMFYGFPLKIKGGDGSPIRAVAILKE